MPPSVFLLASLLLAVVPGPAVAYIVTRTLAQGRQGGLASVAGVALGNLGNAVGASLGLAALLALWSGAFALIQLAGAAYLILLGIGVLRSRSAPPGDVPPPPTPVGRILRDGFIVALLNPKTALFFGAFLPQFIDPAAPALPQSLLLGAVFVAIAAASDAVYVLAAAAVAGRLVGRAGVARVGRGLSGAVFIGLGCLAALAGLRAVK